MLIALKSLKYLRNLCLDAEFALYESSSAGHALSNIRMPYEGLL